MNYYLFLDESGDHGLSNIDPHFSVFVLCGTLLTEHAYNKADTAIKALKAQFWPAKKVILHSRDIRKCEKEFQILLDLQLKLQFYQCLNCCVSGADYTIIASCINKTKYIERYGRLAGDVYEIALSFVIERAIFCLDAIKTTTAKTLKIFIEKRGKREDAQLAAHFQKVLSRGTAFVAPERLKKYNIDIEFRNKQEDISGLQLSDLVAYPIARYVIDPDRANPAFDLIKDKFYQKGAKRYGLKIFP